MADEITTAVQCRHHWVIDSPEGATSKGVCKLCGAEKQFSNATADTVWEDEPYTQVFGRFWNRHSRTKHPPAVEDCDDEYPVAS